MALSNYEKQKRWREKNRALYNFQQRQRRKKGGGEEDIRDGDPPTTTPSLVGSPSPSLPFKTKKVGELNMIVMPEERVEEAPVKPVVLKDDYGRVISEGQWKKLQEIKRRAKEGGYTLDEYSQ